MPNTTVNGITLEYETFGEPGANALVLIQGLVTQMIGWPEPFCRMLAEKGLYTVRFDNRDTGLSTKLEHLGNPDIETIMQRVMAGQWTQPVYTLENMAEDTIGLMNALGIDRACVCGVSMGGMIGQIMAMRYPERLTGLISMQSSTGEMDLPEPTPEAMQAMMAMPPMDREGYIDYAVDIFRVFAGGSTHFDADLQRDICARSYDRCFYPMGFPRQMAALVTAAGRRRALDRVQLPTLVLHGDCDPVVPIAHAQDTAKAIPGSKLKIIQGLGHGMAFPGLWQEVVDAIAQLPSGGPDRWA